MRSGQPPPLFSAVASLQQQCHVLGFGFGISYIMMDMNMCTKLQQVDSQPLRNSRQTQEAPFIVNVGQAETTSDLPADQRLLTRTVSHLRLRYAR